MTTLNVYHRLGAPALPSNDSRLVKVSSLTSGLNTRNSSLAGFGITVYSRIVPHRISADEVAAAQPAGIILSEDRRVCTLMAPHTLTLRYTLGFLLGICYGAHHRTSQFKAVGEVCESTVAPR